MGGQTRTQNKALLDGTKHFGNDNIIKSALGSSLKALVGIQIQVQ